MAAAAEDENGGAGAGPAGSSSGSGSPQQLRRRPVQAAQAQPAQQQPQQQPQQQEADAPLFGRPMLLLFLLWGVLLFVRDFAGNAKAAHGPGAMVGGAAGAAMAAGGAPVVIKPEAEAAAASSSDAGGRIGSVKLAPGLDLFDGSDMPHVIVQYCMKRNFVELQRFLSHRFPELEGRIHGGNYPPPPHAMALVALAGYAQLATLGLMLAGRPLFRLSGFAAAPGWYEAMMANKGQTFACVFLANTLAASMTATGAFEVTYGDEEVFSKLATGRMPTGDELVARFRELGLE